MHADMAGICEARKKRGSTLYRLFCLLDREGYKNGLAKPTLVVISGGAKSDQSEMPDWVYADARAYRDHYRATTPRPVQRPIGIPSVPRR